MSVQQVDPEANVILTSKAKERILEFAVDEGVKGDVHFRVFVTGGGCSGFQYGFSFEKAPEEDDFIMNESGVTLLIDPISYGYLSGCTIDYKESLIGSAFIVDNPNANTTCGCGQSFS